MAVGPLARLLAQLVVPVVAVLARALPAAYAQALQNARKAGVSPNEATKNLLRKTISKSEALQVLNLSEQEATVEAIQRVRVFEVGSSRLPRKRAQMTHLDFWRPLCLVRCFYLFYSNTSGTWAQTTRRKEGASTCNQKCTGRRNCWTSSSARSGRKSCSGNNRKERTAAPAAQIDEPCSALAIQSSKFCELVEKHLYTTRHEPPISLSFVTDREPRFGMSLSNRQLY
jgi:hypothetical protein